MSDSTKTFNLREKFLELPRYNFVLDRRGVRKWENKAGTYVDWDQVHGLLEIAESQQEDILNRTPIKQDSSKVELDKKHFEDIYARVLDASKNTVNRAKTFAIQAHGAQKRKYTGELYHTHLQSVADILSELQVDYDPVRVNIMKAVAWLHDVREDCQVTHCQLSDLFGEKIATDVRWLTDCEDGNRATRKALARDRLSRAPADVQTIKVADMLDNTASVFQHDAKFASVYLREAMLLLDVLVHADIRLVTKLRRQLLSYNPVLEMNPASISKCELYQDAASTIPVTTTEQSIS